MRRYQFNQELRKHQAKRAPILICVKLTARQLRSLIREVLALEWASAPPTRPMFDYMGNPLSPATNDREQLGYLSDPTVDDDEDMMSGHLNEPQEDPEDCWGPVPPVQGDPYVMQDPLARDTSPLPTPPIKR